MPEPKPASPGEFYMGILPDTMDDCRKLVALIGGEALALLVEDLERVIDRDGKVTLVVKDRAVVYSDCTTTTKLKTRRHF